MHLLDVACTIMFQMNVSGVLSLDAVLIACYLINLVSSSIIGGKVPIFLLCHIWLYFLSNLMRLVVYV